MRVVADLHIHSRYARACSKNINLANLEKYARIKGLTLLGTGDALHPKWLSELKAELAETEPASGIYATKTGFPFILQTELSLIYTQNKKGRRIHNIVLMPSFEVVDQVVEALSKKGRLDYDGRPILNLSCVELVEILKEINENIEIIPAHAWTPWFSLFGSMSGFDSLNECFQDQTKHIRAIETGMSSDPAMNWRLSELDKVAIVSFSDSHSHWPWRIGREATVFELKRLSYQEVINAIRKKEIVETLEFFPEEGKYHYDGHRLCGTRMSPKETLANNKLCPVCRKPVTIGVLHRVESLADRPEGFKPASAKPFRNLVPLAEIIAWTTRVPVSSKKVWETYLKLVQAFGSELAALEAPEEKLAVIVNPKIAKTVASVSNLKWNPGFDGEYGTPVIEEVEAERSKTETKIEKLKGPRQAGLGEF